LSYAGNAFDSAYFENNMSFKDQLSMIVFFNQLKKIKHSFVVEKYEIPYLISEYNDLDYILINSDGIAINIWFGRGNKLRAVDSFDALDEIDIHLESCDETTDNDEFDWIHLEQALSYEYKCEDNNESQYSAEYLSEHGILSLPSVRVYGYKYGFKLIKNNQENSFSLENFNIAPDERVIEYDPCMPTYFQDTLFIPQLKIANKSFSVRLKLSTENSTQFMISKNQEALFK
jgi:hypothetical protein